jgi:hypothetical protein
MRKELIGIFAAADEDEDDSVRAVVVRGDRRKKGRPLNYSIRSEVSPEKVCRRGQSTC